MDPAVNVLHSCPGHARFSTMKIGQQNTFSRLTCTHNQMKRVSTLALLILLAAIPAWSQAFSADLAVGAQAGKPKALAKLQVSKGRIHIDVPPHGSGKEQMEGFKLWGLDHNMWVDGRPSFDDLELYGFALLYLSFHPTNGDDLCAQYQAHIRDEFAAVDRKKPQHASEDRHLEKLHCRAMGTEKVDGKDTLKIGLLLEGEPQESELILYVVPHLQFVVKFERNQSWVVLENIKEAPQLEELFHVPSTAVTFD
jgi:hypothetical protein